GVYQSGPLVGLLFIGPVVGSALVGTLGWRSVFLPETQIRSRKLVGNESLLINSSILHQLLNRIVSRGRTRGWSQLSRKSKPFKNSFRFFLRNPDVTVTLFFNGTVNTVYYAVTATISTLFASAYPQLGETEVGLCFLAIGGGMFLGSLTSGKVLDWEF
ncbi:hypothetical protein F5877DRAFT_6331, partial [Lentinula edodes]